jgi:photosystem II stability/assembly factor-like uncharacterized protein
LKRMIYTAVICQLGFSLLIGCERGNSNIASPSINIESSSPTLLPPSPTSTSNSIQSLPANTPALPGQSAIPVKILNMQGKEGWALSKQELLFTTNKGNNWTEKIPNGITPEEILIDAAFSNPVNGFAFYLRNGKKSQLLTAHQTMDGGGNLTGWEIAELPAKEDWETSHDVKPYVFLADYNPNWVLLTSGPALGLMNKSLFQTADHGKSWIRVADISNQVSGYPNGIAFRIPKEGWITATNHGQSFIPFYRTKDAGLTWDIQPLAIPDKYKNGYANTYQVVFDQENDHHGMVTVEFVQDGQRTLIPYETIDDGVTWNPIPYILPDLQGPPIFHFDDLIRGSAVSLDGSTLYTIDMYSKEDWKSVKPNLSLKQISQLNLRHDGMGWVLINGKIMSTSDGGQTWTLP